jgi:hydroxymethylbilane synthase
VSAERRGNNHVGHRPLLQELVLGTRGSELALAQSRMAEIKLREECGIEVRVEIIRTSGDEVTRGAGAGRKGIFTAELERALLDHRIDVAAHSAKDLPSETDGALVIAAVLPRGPVEDLLITKVPAVSSFAKIATGSVRRQRQVRWLKNPREIVDLRGNVPTRLRKFAGSDWDAIILARAGLERLGFFPPQFEFEKLQFFAEILPVMQFVPAGGQGIIALQTRVEDAPLISAIDHEKTHLCLRAEREFLRLLQGDCDLPVGVHARFVGDEMELRAQFFGSEEAPKTASVRGNDPEKLAEDVFKRIEQDHPPSLKLRPDE